MPQKGRGVDDAPLLGPNGRIPTVQAVTITRTSGFTTLRKGWVPRHTMAMVVLSPLLFLGYTAALVAGFDDPFWSVMVAAMSLVAALILTTYVPLPGTRIAPGSSCTLLAGIAVPLPAVLLNQATGPFDGALALAVLGLGLWQRLSSPSAC